MLKVGDYVRYIGTDKLFYGIEGTIKYIGLHRDVRIDTSRFHYACDEWWCDISELEIVKNNTPLPLPG